MPPTPAPPGRLPCHDDTQSGPLNARVAALARSQHGVVSVAQLEALGLGGSGARRRHRRGALHRLHRGVYAVGHDVLRAEGHWLAAVLACGPGAVLSHASAAALWGLRPPPSGRVHVTAPRSVRGPASVVVHRPRALHADDVAEHRGVPVTSVARTLVDLAGAVSRESLERAAHEAEVLRLLDLRSVGEALDRAGSRRGTGALRSLLAEPSAGVTRNRFEARFRRLCRAHGLPEPRMNAPLLGYEVDALWPDARVAVELDGARVHLTRRKFETDRARDAALAAAGYVVLRLTWRRLRDEPELVAGQLRRVLGRLA